MSERFYIDGKISGTVEMTDAEYNHLVNVMRLKAGDEITLFNGGGQDFRARITKIDKRAAYAEILEMVKNNLEARLELTVFQAVLKPEKFFEVITKASELGAKEVIPVITAYSQTPAAAFSADKLKKAAVAAAKQCGRSVLVKTTAPVTFDEILKTLKNYDLSVVPYENETERGLKDVLKSADNIKTVAVIIGAEGGFSPAEVQAAKAAGAIPVTLGARIMRAETAAAATIAAIMYEQNEWN